MSDNKMYKCLEYIEEHTGILIICYITLIHIQVTDKLMNFNNIS